MIDSDKLSFAPLTRLTNDVKTETKKVQVRVTHALGQARLLSQRLWQKWIEKNAGIADFPDSPTPSVSSSATLVESPSSSRSASPLLKSVFHESPIAAPLLTRNNLPEDVPPPSCASFVSTVTTRRQSVRFSGIIELPQLSPKQIVPIVDVTNFLKKDTLISPEELAAFLMDPYRNIGVVPQGDQHFTQLMIALLSQLQSGVAVDALPAKKIGLLIKFLTSTMQEILQDGRASMLIQLRALEQVVFLAQSIAPYRIQWGLPVLASPIMPMIACLQRALQGGNPAYPQVRNVGIGLHALAITAQRSPSYQTGWRGCGYDAQRCRILFHHIQRITANDGEGFADWIYNYPISAVNTCEKPPST